MKIEISERNEHTRSIITQLIHSANELIGNIRPNTSFVRNGSRKMWNEQDRVHD